MGIATIDVTLGFFNQLAKDMGKAIGGTVLIIEEDGKVVGNGSSVQGSAALGNLRDLNIPAAAPLSKLITPAETEIQGTYDGEGGEHTLFVVPISGSPWLLAVDVSSDLLERHSDSILTHLTLVQVITGSWQAFSASGMPSRFPLYRGCQTQHFTPVNFDLFQIQAGR